MKLAHRLALVALILPAAPLALSAAEVDYVKDIEPIFKASCVECHGPKKQKFGLRLDEKALVMKGSKKGPILVAGNSAASKLFKRLIDEDPEERMPHEKDPLPKAEIDKIRAWIDAGAR